jgi:SAM-dependent methyltransferase
MLIARRVLPAFRNTSRTISATRTTSNMASTPRYTVNPLPRSLYPTPFTYTREDFRRQDESSDSEWYTQPRFVQHIDDGAIEALKSYYSEILEPNHSIVDICSSWVSHLPASLKPQSMIGYGMNKQELSRNEHLTKFFVKDLNVDPSLNEVPDESADAVICNVSVDYLTRPVEVFKEMHRVLKSGGTAHMAFSNRCFPTKVIGKWMGMSDDERRRWVGGYFWASGGWEDVEEVILKEQKGGFWGGHEDPLYVVRGRKAAPK